jgi:CheY-like chemotaxis protein
MNDINIKEFKNYKKTNILFLDNQIENKKDITNSLRFKFECIEAKNPRDLLFSYHKYDSDFIIISDTDINVVEETIKAIKSQDLQEPVIIVASNDTSSEFRVKCFEMGANDYIQKPYLPEELSFKIKRLQKFRNKEELKDLKEKNDCTMKEQSELINTTMKQASKYGSTLQLIKKLHSCSTVKDVSSIIFNYLTEWDLISSIMFKDNHNNLEFFDSQNDTCSPMERQVLEMVGSKDIRLHSFNNRTIFVSKHVSLLIKNMPVGQLNHDLYIDILATLIESIYAHYEVLLRTQSLEKSQCQLEGLMGAIKGAMDSAQLEKNKIMDEFLMMLGQSFHVLDFNLEQEEKIQEMLEFLLKKHANSSHSFSKIQVQANEALGILKKELVSSKEKLKDSEELEDNNDVELF